MWGLGKFLFGGLLGTIFGFLVSPKRAQRVRDALLGQGSPTGSVMSRALQPQQIAVVEVKPERADTSEPELGDVSEPEWVEEPEYEVPAVSMPTLVDAAPVFSATTPSYTPPVVEDEVEPSPAAVVEVELIDVGLETDGSEPEPESEVGASESPDDAWSVPDSLEPEPPLTWQNPYAWDSEAEEKGDVPAVSVPEIVDRPHPATSWELPEPEFGPDVVVPEFEPAAVEPMLEPAAAEPEPMPEPAAAEPEPEPVPEPAVAEPEPEPVPEPPALEPESAVETQTPLLTAGLSDLKARIEETRRRIQRELDQPFVADRGAPARDDAPIFGEYPVHEPEADTATSFEYDSFSESAVEEAVEVGELGDEFEAPAAAEEPSEPVVATEEEAVFGLADEAEVERSMREDVPSMAVPEADSQFDHDAMRRRIEETRNRLKAKAFDAMMKGESALLGRDFDGPVVAASSPVEPEPLDSEVAETIDTTLIEEDV